MRGAAVADSVTIPTWVPSHRDRRRPPGLEEASPSRQSRPARQVVQAGACYATRWGDRHDAMRQAGGSSVVCHRRRRQISRFVPCSRLGSGNAGPATGLDSLDAAEERPPELLNQQGIPRARKKRCRVGADYRGAAPTAQSRKASPVCASQLQRIRLNLQQLGQQGPEKAGGRPDLFAHSRQIRFGFGLMRAARAVKHVPASPLWPPAAHPEAARIWLGELPQYSAGGGSPAVTR